MGGRGYVWKLYYAALQHGRGEGKGVNAGPMFGYCKYKKSYREKGKKCNHRFFFLNSNNGVNMGACVS